MSAQDARSALRSATAPYHDRIDRLYSRFDLGDPTAYVRFLTAQATAHLAVEAGLERAGVATVLDDWPGRRRAQLLRADLAEMAIAVPAETVTVAFDGADAVLGGVYVLEGSRLGGRVLRRGIPEGLPNRFLGSDDPAGWRRLLGVIEARLDRADRRRDAIAAAITVFRVFEDAATAHPLAGFEPGDPPPRARKPVPR